jgi:hypothetical protein
MKLALNWKKSSNVNSIGLGLLIVKEIADANSIEVVYRYENNRHTLFSLRNRFIKVVRLIVLYIN